MNAGFRSTFNGSWTKSSTHALTKLSLPNEDFGRIDKRGNPDFEGSTFKEREYSIWASNH